MPDEVYQNRIKQLKQWLDDGHITGNQMILLLGEAIQELFINKFREVNENTSLCD